VPAHMAMAHMAMAMAHMALLLMRDACGSLLKVVLGSATGSRLHFCLEEFNSDSAEPCPSRRRQLRSWTVTVLNRCPRCGPGRYNGAPVSCPDCEMSDGVRFVYCCVYRHGERRLLPWSGVLHEAGLRMLLKTVTDGSDRSVRPP
jgi:hypothetical protein